MKLKNLPCLVLLLFLFIFTQSFAASSSSDKQTHFLALTDIHFNPFDGCQSKSPCPLVETLRLAPVEQWQTLLATYQTGAASYGVDTNYRSLKAALIEAGKRASEEKVRYVVVLGDYLSHEFKTNYQSYSSDSTGKEYPLFVKKTETFVANQLAQAFPALSIYMTVGNNDSYDEDYVSEPNGQFYHDMSDLWAGLIKNPRTRVVFEESFSAGGYYAIDLPQQPNLRLIALNSVLFSAKAKGKGVDLAAQEELNWFQHELIMAHAKHQKVLVILHIPVGVDVYSTLKQTPFSVVELWKPEFAELFQTQLKAFSADIAGILSGHFHMDSFQLLDKGFVTPIPMIGTPAISPGFGNNPAFKIYEYSWQSGTLSNFMTYTHSLSDKEWIKEYSFNQVYQPNCENCRLSDGISLLRVSGDLADRYIGYFSAGTTSNPIVTKHQWQPYYWCDIHAITAADYSNCVSGM